ncbi:MAG TPA: TonB-dependent receptor [Rhodanobacteraceae bacterium]
MLSYKPIALGVVIALGPWQFATAQTTTPEQNRTRAATQKEKPTRLKEIVVTGSHISGAELATDTPAITLGQRQIRATGRVTLGDVVQRLPQIAGSLQSPTDVADGGSGATLVGLRGLGPSRTLILVDGERVLSKDLNSIPLEAVKKIVVLPAGASAIYGSEAIGGVVNIILKTHYSGAQVTLNDGISSHGDGQRHGASLLLGHTTNKGSLLFGVGYTKQDEITAQSRDWAHPGVAYEGSVSNRPLFVGPAGSPVSKYGDIQLSPQLSQEFGCPSGGALALNHNIFNAGASPTGVGDFHCLNASDQQDGTQDMLLMAPQERKNIFVKGNYRLSKNISIYATYYENKTDGLLQVYPSQLSTGFVSGELLSRYSMYNPFGVSFSSSNGNELSVRNEALGPRLETFATTVNQLNAGVRGNFGWLDHTWNWNIGLDFGHTTEANTLSGLPNMQLLLPGLGPSMVVDGVPSCVAQPGDPTSVIPGCTPWDPINMNSPSAKGALASANTPAPESNWALERIWHASINGGLFELPAGTVRVAGGLSHRDEYSNNSVAPSLTIDPATLTCTMTSFCSGHLQGGFSVNTAYAELFIPVLKGLPGIHDLSVDLAERFSRYSDFGSTSNWKVGVDWRPISDLLVRGSATRVFRAPTISDLFAAPGSSAPTLGSDPCDGITSANAACPGVPLTGQFRDSAESGAGGGTSQRLHGTIEGAVAAGFPIRPEQGKSFDLGVVYSPDEVPGLTINADFWRIYLNDVIAPGLGPQTTLDLCFQGDSAFCGLVTRVPSGPTAGQILHVVLPTANLGRFDVKGVDLAASYSMRPTNFGQFSFATSFTYLSQYKIQTAPGLESNQVINGAGLLGLLGDPLFSSCPGGFLTCFLPRMKGTGSVMWHRGDWGASWNIRYTGPFNTANMPQGGVPLYNKFGSYVYNDFSASLALPPLDTVFSIGVNNAFNKEPPIFGIDRAVNGNTDASDFDVVGRYYWARAVVSF